MTFTSLPAIIARVNDENPRDLARRMGAARMTIGATAVLAPAGVTRRWLVHGSPSPDATTVTRMAGGRDLVLGLGTVLAARHESSALRGWLEASGLADAIDAYAFLRDRGFRARPRFAGLLAAAGAAAASVWLARRVDG